MDTSGSEAAAQGSMVARLALLNADPCGRTASKHREWVQEFIGVVKAVGSEEHAMTFRAARLLACAKTMDVSEAGFSSWTAFVTELAPWRASRTRDHVRLVESGLDLVHEALVNNVIDLTVATRAPKALGANASREAQAAWLAEATFATLPKRHPAFMAVLSGDEMRRVLQARELASILIGWAAPVAAVDDFIFDCHERKLTGEQILERARAVPPKPERLGKTVPEWKDDPSVGLLGPWVESKDIHDVIAQLRAMERLMDLRRVVLAVAYDHIKFYALWTDVPGCESLEDLCLQHLEIGQRSFQRYAKEGRCHGWYPEVRKEIEAGRLTADRAAFAMEHTGGGLELVQRLGRAELARAKNVDRTSKLDVLREYAPLLEIARTVEAIVRDDPPQASVFGATAARVAEHLLSVGATGEIQVAVRDDANRRSPRREPDHILVPPGLLAAADYLLAQDPLPVERGTRKTVAHDRYECQNPRCRRRTVRVQPHHMVQRQHGGSDEPANLVPVCPACHLRGIHSGRMSVVRIDDLLVWTWQDKTSVIMGSRLSDLVAAGQDGRRWGYYGTPRARTSA